jgi:hypothetical protein
VIDPDDGEIDPDDEARSTTSPVSTPQAASIGTCVDPPMEIVAPLEA